MLAQKIAGWAKRVLSSTRGNGSSPTRSVTRSRRSGARRARRSRISGVWLPWPGKSTAGACGSVTKLTPPHPGRSTREFGEFSRANPPGGGCAGYAMGGARAPLGDQADALGLLHGLGAVARTELAIERGGVLLDRVGREEEALGDLAVGGAGRDRLEHLPLALGERRPRGRLVGLEDRHAEPDHPHGAGDVGGRPVLGDEARGAGGARGVRGDPPRAGDHQDVRRRDELAQALADRRARLLADEEVHERDVRLVALGHGQRLVGVARAQAALDPRMLAEHQPQPPVHHLVVVDDEHPQAALARSPDRRQARGVDVRGAHTGTAMRTRQVPGSRSPNSTIPPACSASSAASFSPIPVVLGRPPTPSLQTSRNSVSSWRSSDTSTLVGRACLWALRTASARTDWASGSIPLGTLTRSDPRLSARWRSGCSRARRSTSSSSVVWVSGAERPSGRCSARRRSTSAACSSAAMRWRASGLSSAEDENTSWTPNRR